MAEMESSPVKIKKEAVAPDELTGTQDNTINRSATEAKKVAYTCILIGLGSLFLALSGILTVVSATTLTSMANSSGTTRNDATTSKDAPTIKELDKLLDKCLKNSQKVLANSVYKDNRYSYYYGSQYGYHHKKLSLSGFDNITRVTSFVAGAEGQPREFTCVASIEKVHYQGEKMVVFASNFPIDCYVLNFTFDINVTMNGTVTEGVSLHKLKVTSADYECTTLKSELEYTPYEPQSVHFRRNLINYLKALLENPIWEALASELSKETSGNSTIM